MHHLLLLLGACRPAEILSRCNTAMCQLSLAEAQALTAFRAQYKGTSASVVASLHAGAAELYEKAAKTIRDYIGKGLCCAPELSLYYFSITGTISICCREQCMFVPAYTARIVLKKFSESGHSNACRSITLVEYLGQCSALLCGAGDYTVAADRFRRYIAVGSGLSTARAHKVN